MTTQKAKPELRFTLLCDDVRQELGGKFSLMGLFESISAPVFPAVHHRFAIVNEWAGGTGEFTARIRLLTPDRGQVLSESESTFSLYTMTQHHRDISIRLNTTFTVPGTYWIETLINGEPAGFTPLPVLALSDKIVH